MYTCIYGTVGPVRLDVAISSGSIDVATAAVDIVNRYELQRTVYIQQYVHLLYAPPPRRGH